MKLTRQNNRSENKQKYILSDDGKTLISWLDHSPIAQIPEGVVKISTRAFNSDVSERIYKLVIPYSVKVIPDRCFSKMCNLEEIECPDDFNILSILDTPVFYEFVDDNGFVIQENTLVRYLGNESDVVIPANITNIGKYAFQGCSKLITVTMLGDVSSIGDNAFFQCFNLETVDIPESVTRIGSRAFYQCRKLTNIVLPRMLINIGPYAFTSCAFTHIDIPSGVTVIRHHTFMWCTKLIDVKIPDSVTTIGTEAFSGSGLQSVTISNNVKTIGDRAFCDCGQLSDISIGDSVTEIGWNAFALVSKDAQMTTTNSCAIEYANEHGLSVVDQSRSDDNDEDDELITL